MGAAFSYEYPPLYEFCSAGHLKVVKSYLVSECRIIKKLYGPRVADIFTNLPENCIHYAAEPRARIKICLFFARDRFVQTSRAVYRNFGRLFAELGSATDNINNLEVRMTPRLSFS